VAYVAVFVSVFLAELGDKTQLATLLFASNPALRPWAVFAASAGALLCSSLAAVLIGRQMGAWLPEPTLAAGMSFIVIGGWILARAWHRG
jgi:putative Ca2+/H+ antiporter (TMEM165/GDT1 family)